MLLPFEVDEQPNLVITWSITTQCYILYNNDNPDTKDSQIDINYQSDTYVSDWCVIDVDPRVFDISVQNTDQNIQNTPHILPMRYKVSFVVHLEKNNHVRLRFDCMQVCFYGNLLTKTEEGSINWMHAVMWLTESCLNWNETKHIKQHSVVVNKTWEACIMLGWGGGGGGGGGGCHILADILQATKQVPYHLVKSLHSYMKIRYSYISYFVSDF